ncbi:MAG: leucine-rich repeat domain-containing protein [Candidatus Limisoma sp.]
MTLKKQICSLLALILMPILSYAYDFEVDGIYYNINPDGETVSVTYREEEESSYSGDVVIPSEVTYDGKTYSVTEIGKLAFGFCEGQISVIIPNSVTKIGNFAFLASKSMKSIIIPDSVTIIGESAFEMCNALSSLSIGNSVTEIGNRAFCHCQNLTSVVIPNSVITIGDEVFIFCRYLSSITIGNSVNTIGRMAFAACESLTSIVIPDSVTEIGFQAFVECGKLTSVTMSNSVTTLEEGIFRTCYELASFTIPNSVTKIGDYAFDNCQGLTSIIIPDSVTEIGKGAFDTCSGLKKVEISDLEAWCNISFGNNISNPLYYAHHLYLNGTEITNLIIPDTVTTIRDWSFNDCYGLNTLTIGNSVNSIGTEAFVGCTGIKLLNWNATSYPDFPNSAFAGCPISSVIIGDDVTTVPNDFFKDNTSIKNITIGEQVESFGTNALAGCTGIKSITWKPINYTGVLPFPAGITPTNFSFGNSVETIPDYLCYGYSDISSIALPPSVKKIGDMAFYGCNPTKVTCRAAVPPTISETTFSQSAYDAPLFVYESSEDEYINHEIWRNFYDTQFLPGGIVEEPVSLSVLFPDRGEVAVEVPYNKTTTVKVFPDNVDGYRLSSVTFNGEDILDSLDADYRYTTPKLTADAVISVVYVSDKGSVDQTAADSIKVSASSGMVRIMGAAPESEATVCDMSGNIVRKTAEKTFTLDKGIYILTVEGISFKFAL